MSRHRTYEVIPCGVCGTKFRKMSTTARYCSRACYLVVQARDQVARRRARKLEACDRDDPDEVIERKLAAWERYRKQHPMALEPWRTAENPYYNPYFDTRGV